MSATESQDGTRPNTAGSQLWQLYCIKSKANCKRLPISLSELTQSKCAEVVSSPFKRKAAWRALEADFRPHITFDGIPYLEEGTRWQYQMHIYETPFYYIDYCLAQTAALQFLLESQKDYDDAFRRYVHFLSQGGEKVFTDLLQEAGLRSPFQEGALRQVAQESEALLRKLQSDIEKKA